MDVLIDNFFIIGFICGIFGALSLVYILAVISHRVIMFFQDLMHTRRIMEEKRYYQKVMMKKLTTMY